MLTCGVKELAEKIKIMRLHGMSEIWKNMYSAPQDNFISNAYDILYTA